MPNLDCSVKTCYYNKENKCCLDGIRVKGANADDSCSTACGSFREGGSEGFKSSCECDMKPSEKSQVQCEAVNCVYNEEKRCAANGIDISGMQAKKFSDTECKTFKMK